VKYIAISVPIIPVTTHAIQPVQIRSTQVNRYSAQNTADDFLQQAVEKLERGDLI
jgi:hypothetical protein